MLIFRGQEEDKPLKKEVKKREQDSTVQETLKTGAPLKGDNQTLLGMLSRTNEAS